MSKHAKPSSPWRPLSVAVLAGLVLLGTGAGVLAVLTASATGTQSVGTGTLSLVAAPSSGSTAAAISGANPGDSFAKYLDITSNGTLGATGLTVSASLSALSVTPAVAPFDSTGAAALQVGLETCSGSWTVSSGACSGTVTTLVPLTDTGSLTAKPLLTGNVAAGQVLRVKVTYQVQGLNEVTVNGTPPTTTVQGKGGLVTLTFTENQRAATVTNS